jgi:pimeloyl-ACP methyl ester carboxylesterase
VGEPTASKVDYGAGKWLDIYLPETPRGSVAALFWHGRGANERDVLEPLARRIAMAGVCIIVPDWCTDDGANGRRDLGLSLSFARSELAKFTLVDRIVLAGWSLGASAGLEVVQHPELVGGWRPAAFVGISGGYQGSPYEQEGRREFSVDSSIPLLLVHGTSDEIVPVERSRKTYQQLQREGWNVTLKEVPADHAGAIGTSFDPGRHRCVPTVNPARLEVLATIGTLIAEFAQSG